MGETMQDENYYTVQGWMINRLKLSGTRLHTFAIIYGFSQHNGNEFKGSINYFCEMLGCSPNSVRACLRDLRNLGYINKNVSYCDGVILNSYSVNMAVISDLIDRGVQNLQGVQNLVPNNILLTTSSNIQGTKHTGTLNTSSKARYNNVPNSKALNKTSTPRAQSKRGPVQRVLIQPKKAKTGSPSGFSGSGGISALLGQIEGGKAVLDKFVLFMQGAKESGLRVGRVWVRSQVDLINWVEDPEDKILVLQKTIERGWKSLRFVIEDMFGCKIESQRRDIITKTKIGGCKYD